MADETPAPLSDAEVKGAIDEAITCIEVFRSDRVAGPAEHAEVNAHIALLERIPATLAARDAHLAALERENAALREIVAAVADGWSNALGTRIGTTPADGLALKAQARTLLATQTPATPATGATAQAGEEGE